ncbi:TIGR01459 family HAD-type hydrolase [Aestuariivirga sp.]|uniref:TIGR01459 family HAD-type hydrolase n=1 Tax=Aestuariivirga sp. TaxID=2650926 RepID=UPI0025C1D092|nr:TIGR01459 family HAD-type hydrolase [Aestuariivirga sp.]MCA3555518.1 TIGR01459 family HAD-type hydrolase [Aestuariivirga sp.]
MEHFPRFAPLAARYDGFIVDLWGVIHDGVAPYPGARDLLQKLQEMERRVVLLSNAPRRVASVRDDLLAMGVSDDLYDGLMTSGEAVFEALSHRSDPWVAELGRKVYFLGPERDWGILNGLELHQVERPAAADFVIITAPDDLQGPSTINDHLPALEQCLAAGLPMICANPDFEIVRDGQRIICAGALARHYETLGGEVRWYGKPDAAIYPSVLEILEVSASRVLAVGDGLRTDIAGARAANLASCWVLGGIHAEELEERETSAEALANAVGHYPSTSVPEFKW